MLIQPYLIHSFCFLTPVMLHYFNLSHVSLTLLWIIFLPFFFLAVPWGCYDMYIIFVFLCFLCGLRVVNFHLGWKGLYEKKKYSFPWHFLQGPWEGSCSWPWKLGSSNIFVPYPFKLVTFSDIYQWDLLEEVSGWKLGWALLLHSKVLPS